MVEIINEGLSGLNHLGSIFCHYAIGAFLQSALLVTVLFGMDLLLRNRVRAVVRYCIWLLVLVKLILPPTLSLPTGIAYWTPSRVLTVAQVPGRPVPAIEFEHVTQEQATPPRPQPADELAPAEEAAINAAESDSDVAPVPVSLTPITWQAIVLLFWLVGMLAFVVLLAQRIRFVRGLVAASTGAEGPLLVALEECCRQMRLRGRVRLRTFDALPSPAVCGLWQPTILMPTSLVTKLSPDGLKAALIHELAHIKRADLWVNAVQTVLQVVYFYNPFVWLANAIISRTCEEAVDETVLVTLGGQVRDYSNTLIRISDAAFWKADLGLRLIGVAESKKALKRRIRHMVTRPVPQSARIGVLGTVAILLIAALLLPMARGERSNQETSTPSAAVTAQASETTSSAKVGDTIVDPNTGVKFVLAKTFSGASNVITAAFKMVLSPDRRFLVGWGHVVPLDGTAAYRWAEHRDGLRDVAVSPNEQYIAHGEKAIWVQPISSETLRANGPAKKLVDLGEGRLVGRNNGRGLRWTRDSQTVFFTAYTEEGGIRQYAFSAETGAAVSYPDAASAGLLSPDRTCIALTPTDPLGGYWVKPIGDGAARLLGTRPPGEPRPPLCWSTDGHWLIGDQLNVNGVVRFLRYPEGQEYLISMPKELPATCCVGSSADGSKLFFYQEAYGTEWRLKVASADGAPLRYVDSDIRYAFRPFQWSRDGEAILQNDFKVYEETGLLMSPLSEDEPVQFALRPALSIGDTPLAVSPDSKWLLFTPRQESGSKLDLSVIPLSMVDHRVSGPATIVFRIQDPPRGGSLAQVWSPDSTRVALTCTPDRTDEQDVWIVFADGRTPIRLTQTVAMERELKWSPDGNMLAFFSDDAGAVELKVVPTAGGEAVVLRKWVDAALPAWGWSPDSKALTIAEKGMLVRQPVSGGKAEPIVDLQEDGIGVVTWLGWSPDGSQLALTYRVEDTSNLPSPGPQLMFARVEGGHLQKTTAVTVDGGGYSHAWSPDSKHVAYLCEDSILVRPEGRLYAVAVDDIVERIEAGAIPPTGPAPGEPSAAGTPPESEPTPKPEPITGSFFSDNFDNGLSKEWQIVDWNPKGSPPPAHAVENGQLMLSNCSARLSQIDWANYRVTVRVCLMEANAPVSIQARVTPSNFRLDDMVRYSFTFSGPRNAPATLSRIGLQYYTASGVPKSAALGLNPCPLVPERWYKLAFEVRGEQLRAYLDDKLIIDATDARLSKGAVWISAAGPPVLFDDFSVRRLP